MRKRRHIAQPIKRYNIFSPRKIVEHLGWKRLTAVIQPRRNVIIYMFCTFHIYHLKSVFYQNNPRSVSRYKLRSSIFYIQLLKDIRRSYTVYICPTYTVSCISTLQIRIRGIHRIWLKINITNSLNITIAISHRRIHDNTLL